MRMRKFLSVVALQFLYVLCVNVMFVLRKMNGSAFSPEVKADILGI
jgi:hypothetical protein